MQVLGERVPDGVVVPLRRTQRTADALVDVLAEAGVEVVFGIPGGTIAPLLDAFLDRPGIRYITTKHEAAAVFAAAAYARHTQRLGVVAVTSGPGILNTMTGLASAFCDGLPVVVIAGEVARAVQGRLALQEGSAHHLNVVGITSHITKLSIELPTSTAAPTILRRALATAVSGKKGPVVVTVPIDVAGGETRTATAGGNVRTEFNVDETTLAQAAAAFQSSRTVIFAGSGVRWDDGPARLRELAERTQTPVMTTPKGKGVFPESHPLALGVFGLGGHPSAEAYLDRGIDVMLAVGTSLGELATHAWSRKLMPRRALIHIDVESCAIARNYPVDISITARASDALRILCERAAPFPHPVRTGIQYHMNPQAFGGGRPISPPRALWEIQQALPSDAVYCVDAGEHSVFATHYLRIDRPDSFVAMTGLGSMGSSFGAAIGIKVAEPRRPVAVICGDGGYALAASELSTAAAEGLPLRIFVLNDHRLGMVERGNVAIYGRTPPYPNRSFNVAAHARAVGAVALLASRPGDILAAGTLLSGDHGPVVVDIEIDTAVNMPRNQRFEQLGKALGAQRDDGMRVLK